MVKVKLKFRLVAPPLMYDMAVQMEHFWKKIGVDATKDTFQYFL